MSKSAARFAQYRAEKAAGVFGKMFAGGNSWVAGRGKTKPTNKRKRLPQYVASELDEQAQFLFRRSYALLSKKHKKKVCERVGMLRRVAKRLLKKPAIRPAAAAPSAPLLPQKTRTKPLARVEPSRPVPPAAPDAIAKEPLIQLQTGKSAALTYNELVFRVLLQREEARPKLSFSSLELALPKPIRKLIEPDWRGYIRDENLEFDSAYQKAVRKHLPGVYHVIMAAEFFGKLPFHVALGYFLQPEGFPWGRVGISEDDTFALAERLAVEVRRRRAEATRQTQVQQVARPVVSKPPGLTRRCAFCKQWVPESKISEHVDRLHINPPRLVGRKSLENKTSPQLSISPQVCGEPVAIVPSAAPTPAPDVPRSQTSMFSRFRTGRCIGCGNIPIPGDFYCYHCSPD